MYSAKSKASTTLVTKATKTVKAAFSKSRHEIKVDKNQRRVEKKEDEHQFVMREEFRVISPCCTCELHLHASELGPPSDVWVLGAHARGRGFPSS